MSTVGPMARSVDDLRLALRLLAGPDGMDHDVPPMGWQDAAPPEPATLRVAWASSVPGTHSQAEIATSVAGVARHLGDLGALVEECLPAVDVAEQYRLGAGLFGLLASTFADDGQQRSLETYLELVHRRDAIMAAWDRFLAEWDALILPAGNQTAPAWDAKVEDSYDYPKALSCVSGCPMIVIPAGIDQHGLPFGLQMLGRRWNDEHLLNVAQLVSRFTPGFQRPPGL